MSTALERLEPLRHTATGVLASRFWPDVAVEAIAR